MRGNRPGDGRIPRERVVGARAIAKASSKWTLKGTRRGGAG